MEKRFTDLPEEGQKHLMLHLVQGLHTQLLAVQAQQLACLQVQQLILQQQGYSTTRAQATVAEIVAIKLQEIEALNAHFYQKEFERILKNYS